MREDDSAALTWDANEVWEMLFGILKGDVPEQLNDDVCSKIADALNEAAARDTQRQEGGEAEALREIAVKGDTATVFVEIEDVAARLDGFPNSVAWAAARRPAPEASPAGEVSALADLCERQAAYMNLRPSTARPALQRAARALRALAPPSAATPAATGESGELRRVASAAERYYTGWAQDEADLPSLTGCDDDQHLAAVELRDALSALRASDKPGEE